MKKPEFKIGSKLLGLDHAPFIIAELSANHNGDIENAYAIIKMAKDCGADAVKMQTYKPDTITLNSQNEDFLIKDGLWAGRTLYQLYDWAHTPWEWHSELFSYAHSIKFKSRSTNSPKTQTCVAPEHTPF